MSAAASPVPTIDPVALAADLIRRPSVTPEDAGALDVLAAALVPHGFRAERMRFSAPGTPDVDNLFLRFGSTGAHFCFAGHTDVVPPGDRALWTVDPFEARVEGGHLIGRGAADMKGAIAAFAAAAARVAPAIEGRGSIGLLITGDEEGPAVNGTVKMLERLRARGERIDHCLVGEPTSLKELGDVMKIGRRGSATGRLRVIGAQGHVAYPDRALNPIPTLLSILSALTQRRLDDGTEHFEPSNLEVTTIDVGNPATNVIPAEARAVFNIRHNDRHDGASLEAWARRVCDAATAARGGAYELDWTVGGECFLTQPSAFTALVADAIRDETGRPPAMTTGGGTSDARFIKDHCPVVEFGLPGESMHKIDEKAAVADVERLSRIYETILNRYFDGARPL